MAVTPWGDLYPCHQFVGNEKFLMGNVDDGILKPEIRDRFAACNVYSKPGCKDCFAKFYCSGGCAANSYNFHGDITSSYEVGCELQKKRVEGCDDLRYDEGAFKSKLIEKLLPGRSSPFDKVRVAYAFAHILSDKDVNIELSEEDAYISYLVKAINHVCPAIPDGD